MLQEGELKHSYSLIDRETFDQIPSELVLLWSEVEDRLYTEEELETLRDELIS